MICPNCEIEVFEFLQKENDPVVYCGKCGHKLFDNYYELDETLRLENSCEWWINNIHWLSDLMMDTIKELEKNRIE